MYSYKSLNESLNAIDRSQPPMWNTVCYIVYALWNSIRFESRQNARIAVYRNLERWFLWARSVRRQMDTDADYASNDAVISKHFIWQSTKNTERERKRDIACLLASVLHSTTTSPRAANRMVRAVYSVARLASAKIGQFSTKLHSNDKKSWIFCPAVAKIELWNFLFSKYGIHYDRIRWVVLQLLFSLKFGIQSGRNYCVGSYMYENKTKTH